MLSFKFAAPALATLATALPFTSSLAQAIGPGPSDPSRFDAVISLPEDQASIGGSVGDASGEAGSTTQLNVASGGTIVSGSGAEPESELPFNAFSGSEVNIGGGSVGSFFMANSGSVVNLSGGSVGAAFEANAGSEVNVTGGTVGQGFSVNTGSQVALFGGEFRLNGVAFTAPTISLAEDDVFTGTLADGSPFIFADQSFDELTDVRLTAAPLPTLDPTPIVLNRENPTGPTGLRAGQTLTLQPGGRLSDDFAVVNATLNVEGDFLGATSGLEVANSVVNLSEDAFVEVLNVFSDSVININGAQVLGSVQADSGSVININDGNIFWVVANESVVNLTDGFVNSLFVQDDSIINVSGGTVTGQLRVSRGGEANISGGQLGPRTEFRSDTKVNLFGTEFFLDGVSLEESLTLNEAFTLTDRDGQTLTGTFADGNEFSFNIDGFGSFFEPSISPAANITLTLVPEPATIALIGLGSVLLASRRRRAA